MTRRLRVAESLVACIIHMGSGTQLGIPLVAGANAFIGHIFKSFRIFFYTFSFLNSR